MEPIQMTSFLLSQFEIQVSLAIRGSYVPDKSLTTNKKYYFEPKLRLKEQFSLLFGDFFCPRIVKTANAKEQITRAACMLLRQQ